MAVGSARLTTQASQSVLERRREKRMGLKLAARVRSADLKNGGRYEILVTVNASRESFYFITATENYYVRMRLRVTFPFNSEHDIAVASEDDGEVIRVDRLPGKRIGVAVKLRGTARMARSTAAKARPSATGRTVAERRIATRQPFSAEAVVVDPHANIRVQARCSDLSLEGCYVDTLNPLPQGTISHVELRTADGIFEAVARVNSSHMGMGMGLCFQDLTPDQISVLDHWLSGKPGGRMRVAGPPEPAKREESMDRTLAINMVRHMLSTGILTRADISDIFLNTGII